MNYDLILFALFCLALFIFFKTHRSKFEVQGRILALYKTKIGIKFMERFTKLPKWMVHLLSISSIIIGFGGMALMFWVILKGTFDLLTIPEAQPVLAPVLPGIAIPGLPKLSFLHWILSIFIVAVIHEFSHGIFARFHKTKVKSSGFLILGPILGAFVEPDENELKKKSAYKQLSIFAAGSFSNIITGIIILLLAGFIINPIANGAFDFNGVKVASVDKNFPASNAGLQVDDQIISIDNSKIKNINDFVKVLNAKKPNEEITLKTNNQEYEIKLAENPLNKELGYLGVRVTYAEQVVKKEVQNKYGATLPRILYWIKELFGWLWLISIGIGLFNLLPLGPIDGGRMFLTGLGVFVKKEKNVKRIWGFISFLILALIAINLLPFFWKLLVAIFGPLASLII